MKKHVKSSAWEKDLPNFLAISPLDGRNHHKIANLSNYFSELALNKARLYVEITYLIHLSKIGVAPKLSAAEIKKVEKIHTDFDEAAMGEVRQIEHTTNHDVKAVEYFLKSQLEKFKLNSHLEFVHWALASEDVNNLSYALLLRDYHQNELLGIIDHALDTLANLAERSDIPMLGRTHGQPASVTTMSKELAVYLSRFQQTLDELKKAKFYGKLSGATGAYVDQLALDNTKNWPKLNSEYIKSIGLEPQTLTTQILPYEPLAHYFSQLRILQDTAVDLCQNLWWYVSFDYFIQKKVKTETGSSIMPHKINPIYLEGAEGGFQTSNALLDFYSHKFLHSRLQRDLSDTTVRRSFGIAFGYSYLSWQSLIEAMERLTTNKETIDSDLENHWEILAAPIQNYLRTQGFDHPYELMKEKTRGLSLSKKEMLKLIDSLQLDTKDKQHILENMTPAKLAKTASQLAAQTIKKYKQKRK